MVEQLNVEQVAEELFCMQEGSLGERILQLLRSMLWLWTHSLEKLFVTHVPVQYTG